MWMLKCCVYEKQAVLLLAVWGSVCKRAAVEQPTSCGELMCHAVGAMLWVQPAAWTCMR